MRPPIDWLRLIMLTIVFGLAFIFWMAIMALAGVV